MQTASPHASNETSAAGNTAHVRVGDAMTAPERLVLDACELLAPAPAERWRRNDVQVHTMIGWRR